MLEEKISQDYITAMKARDQVKSSTLNFLRSQLKYVIIEKKVKTLEDADVIAIIKKQVKQRQDSIEQYQAGGRQELADKEIAEMAILKSYLPQEMDEATLLGFIQESIKEANATSSKDMGIVMKVLMPKVAGKADNKMVSDLLKKTLASL